MFGGDLAHDPAHCIDDIRLAAAVWADDTDEVAGDVDGDGIYEGFETRKLDLAQPHFNPVRIGLQVALANTLH